MFICLFVRLGFFVVVCACVCLFKVENGKANIQKYVFFLNLQVLISLQFFVAEESFLLQSDCQSFFYAEH